MEIQAVAVTLDVFVVEPKPAESLVVEFEVLHLDGHGTIDACAAIWLGQPL